MIDRIIHCFAIDLVNTQRKQRNGEPSSLAVRGADNVEDALVALHLSYYWQRRYNVAEQAAVDTLALGTFYGYTIQEGLIEMSTNKV